MTSLWNIARRTASTPWMSEPFIWDEMYVCPTTYSIQGNKGKKLSIPNISPSIDRVCWLEFIFCIWNPKVILSFENHCRGKCSPNNTICATIREILLRIMAQGSDWRAILAQLSKTNESGIQNTNMCIFLTKAHFRASKNKQEPYCTYFPTFYFPPSRMSTFQPSCLWKPSAFIHIASYMTLFKLCHIKKNNQRPLYFFRFPLGKDAVNVLCNATPLFSHSL